ncbi:hypothetical protein Micbo1qcDRAFT_96439, partial [Microdochium bolleyi]
LRFDHEIHLSNDFPTRGRRSQRVRMPIPGPEIGQPPACSPQQSAQEQFSPTRPQFQSALRLVREVIGTDRRLTIELVRSYERVRQWREIWGYSPLSSTAFESSPPYSPPRERHSPPIASPPSPDHPLSPVPDPIPNPPIPGDPAPSAEVLFERVNTFAKANGFGIVRRNAYSYKGRKIR